MRKIVARKCNAFDAYLGQALRKKRRGLDITQEAIAELTGVSFQQIQKYEKGINRMSAWRLYEVSRFLKIDVNKLFDQFAKEDGIGTNIKGDVISDGNNVGEVNVIEARGMVDVANTIII